MKIETQSVELIDVAWAAGFIDGEGCFTSSNTGVFVRVAHTHLPSLERLQKMFGGSIESHKGTHKPAWRWVVCGDTAKHTCQTLLPYLFEKQLQADLVLELLRIRSGRGIKPTQEIKEYRKLLRKELSELKK